MKRKLSLVVILLTALLLSSCTIQFNTTIEKDGSGSVAVEIGFSETDIEMLDEFDGGTPEDFCEDMEDEGADIPEGATFEIEERGDEIWCVFTTPFDDIDELKDIYEEMGMTVNELELVDGELIYDIDVDMSDAGTDDLGIPGIDLLWVVTVPGSVGENNADSEDGKTLTWDLEDGGVINVNAESSSGGLNSIWWWVIGIGLACLCLLVLVGGGAGIFFYMRKKNTDEEVEVV